MKIQRIECGYLEENCYVISNEEEAIIIDPGADEEIIENYITKQELKVIGILITHYHFDHIGALEYFKEKYGLRVLDYTKPGKNKIGSFAFETVLTPGHTSDSCSFYFNEERVLFSGDFLFKESIGRYDFETSSFTDMQKSISWVKKLPLDINIYPGHGDNTTIKYELKHNMFLK